MCDSVTDDPMVTSLLAMAEFFLSQHPLPVSEAVHCLLAVLAQQPVARVEASVRLRLGVVLSEHTSCVVEAREHLEKAMLVAGAAANLQDVRFHAASTLSSLLAGQGQYHQARGLLRGKLEATSHHPYWHIRLLLQLADLLVCEGDVSGQLVTLSRCEEYAHSVGASHTHLLTILARGAILLTNHRYSEAGSVLNQSSSLLEAYSGPHHTLIKTFYLTIQVTHLLMAGQVKTAKPHLKQLQQCVQTLSNQPDERAGPTLTSDLSAESFLWLTRPHAYITVYLVSVLHSVQAGFTDKAMSYVHRALQLIDQETVSSTRPSGVLGVLRAHVLEQSVQCLLMRGESVAAGSQLQEIVDTCHSHQTLVYSHRAVLHTLLGLYAFATAGLERAIAQFQTALQHTNCKELRVLISLNLAICFMKIGETREAELTALMTSVNSDGANITCQSLQSAMSYVRGLFSFTSGRLHDAKRELRETLTVANGSDLNKLTSCSLLLLGQIFLALGNTKETLDMVTPALQLSVKMPDNRLQVWAASLLADLYRTLGEGEKEKLLRQQSNGILHQLTEEEKKAVSGRAHQLLQWTIGEWPATSTPSQEGRGHEKPAANYSSPTPSYSSSTPRRNSMTVNGSPVTLRTPEIVLKRVESPISATPPRSLLTMATKVQTTPTRPQTPPPDHHHTQIHVSSQNDSSAETLSKRESEHTQQPPRHHNPSTHHFHNHTQTHHPSPDTHHSHHPTQSHHSPSTHPPHHSPSTHPPHHSPSTHPPHHSPSTHPPHHSPSTHPPHHSPSTHPPHHSPSTHDPLCKDLSPYSSLRHTPQSPHNLFQHHSSPSQQSHPPQPHKTTPPHPNYITQQEAPSLHHQPRPLIQLAPPTLPSYHEHSLVHRSLTPPSLTGSAHSRPQSPKLHHLSPSHTSPPSMVSPYVSLAHRDPAVEQHMLQTQQRLLWQQSYLQAQQNHQRVALSGHHLQPVAPHHRGLSPHYVVQGGVALAPPQLSHMTTLQHMSREPSRNTMPGLALPSSSLPPSSLPPSSFPPSSLPPSSFPPSSFPPSSLPPSSLPPSSSGFPAPHMTLGLPSQQDTGHHHSYQRR